MGDGITCTQPGWPAQAQLVRSRGGGVGLVQGTVDSSAHPRGRDLSVMGYVGVQLRAGVWTRDLLMLKLLRRDGISLVVQWLRVNLLMQGV